MMKKTSLYDEHRSLGARFVEFAGWEMPILYSSIVEEHTATRNAAALFDVSHMGEFILRGPGAGKFISTMIPTSLERLAPNKTMYSVLCNERGGVVDDLFIYMKKPDEYMLVVNAGTREKDLEWLKGHIIPRVDIDDISDNVSKIDLQGPQAPAIAMKLFGNSEVSSLKRFLFSSVRFRDEEITISQTGYTGEVGYELYMGNTAAPDLWKNLLAAGADMGIKPAGLGARDTLRLEACYSLYGHELSDDISPVESGLGWLVNSSVHYIGRDALLKQIGDGSPRSLIVFEMTERGIPRDNQRILSGDNDIGVVTSGTFSPTFQKGIGMGLVTRGSVSTDSEITIMIRDRGLKARVAKRPLYSYGGQR